MTLPTLASSAESVPRISCDTVARLMAGEFLDGNGNGAGNGAGAVPFGGSRCISHFLIIDCRFDYEFVGGHIRGAVNLNCKEQIQRFYAQNRHAGSRVALVFHCEFSKYRGPSAAAFLREYDRAHNEWPALRCVRVGCREQGREQGRGQNGSSVREQGRESRQVERSVIEREQSERVASDIACSMCTN